MVNNYKWEKISYLNDRNLLLTGLMHTGPGASKVVIVCHGFSGSKEGGGRALDMAEEIGRMGYATLLFDFSGCGESQGEFADISLSGQVNDLSCSVDFCLKAGFEEVITVGRSFGAATVICHGGTDRRVSGVSAWATTEDLAGVFSSFIDTSVNCDGNMAPLTGERGTVYIKKSFFYDLEKFSVAGLAALLAPRPLQLIHGSGDTVVPPGNSTTVYNAAGEPKEIWFIPDADHQFTGRHRDVWDLFFPWLKKHFPVNI